MATNTFQGTYTETYQLSLTQTQNAGAALDSIQQGQANCPTVNPAMIDGTNVIGGVKEMFRDLRTVAAGANDDINLFDGTFQNGLNQNVIFTGIKLVLIEISSPDGAMSLQIGPGIVSGGLNQFVGWNNAATNYETVFDGVCRRNLSGANLGWTVDGTHKLLGIKNPGASSVTYFILILGTK